MTLGLHLKRLISIGFVSFIMIGSAVAQSDPFPGAWDTEWGTAHVFEDRGSYYGTYDEDHGRFRIDPTGGGLIGVWAESVSDKMCNTQRLGSYHWGWLEMTEPVSPLGFTIKWGYCEGGKPTEDWVFKKRSGDIQDQVIERVMAKLRGFLRVQGATPSGQAVDGVLLEDLIQVRVALRSFGYSDAEWGVVLKEVGGLDGFDPKRAAALINLARSLQVTDVHPRQKTAQRTAMVSGLGLPGKAADYIEKKFFLSDKLLNPDVALEVAGDYMLYAMSLLINKDPEVMKLLTPAQQADMQDKLKFFVPADTRASMRAMPPGAGRLDCGFSAVLTRMRRSDPQFDSKWHMATGVFGPGDLRALAGNGAAVAKSMLMGRIRVQMRKCREQLRASGENP